jgi:long-chain acyl-CoA synthetase
MMTGYHGQPGKTAEAEWFDAEATASSARRCRPLRRGRLPDPDGPQEGHDHLGRLQHLSVDLEAVLRSTRRCRSRRDRRAVGRLGRDAGRLRGWTNGRVGKTQRLADLQVVDALPRSHIGKVLKRELARFWPAWPPRA